MFCSQSVPSWSCRKLLLTDQQMDKGMHRSSFPELKKGVFRATKERQIQVIEATLVSTLASEGLEIHLCQVYK